MKYWNSIKPTQSFTSQDEWNQTLVFVFYELSVRKQSPVLIKVPTKFKFLIESLDFYDSTTNKLGHKFIIEFYNSDNDIIYVDNEEIKITNNI